MFPQSNVNVGFPIVLCLRRLFACAMTSLEKATVFCSFFLDMKEARDLFSFGGKKWEKVAICGANSHPTGYPRFFEAIRACFRAPTV